MVPFRRSRRSISHTLRYLALSAALTLAGCASPGPPHAPSLQLPQPVRDLTAQRLGNTVELRFTPPANSTDKLALRGNLNGQLCRQLPHQPCLPVPSSRISLPVPNPNDTHNLVTLTDTLPPSLTDAPPQLLIYRVEFFSPSNHSAGPSNHAFTASGPAPTPVQNLQAEGSRLGILLHWSPSPGNVVLHRENLAPAKSRHSAPIWLQTNDSNSQFFTLDTAVLPETPYRYTAQRRTTLQLAGHTLDLRSDPSSPVTITLSRTYPPPTPTELTVASYTTEKPSTFAVDLIWQPANEPGLITPLAGYNIYRQSIDSKDEATGPRTQLNTAPILRPAFHDTTANPAATYRYSVIAIDVNGNESPAITKILPPNTTP